MIRIILLSFISIASIPAAYAQDSFGDQYDSRESLYQYEKRQYKKRVTESDNYDYDTPSFESGSKSSDDRYQKIFKDSKGNDLSYEKQKRPKSSEGVLRDLLKSR